MGAQGSLVDCKVESFHTTHDKWIRCLREHSIVLGENLSPEESKFHSQNEQFLFMFDCLLKKLHNAELDKWEDASIQHFTSEAARIASYFKSFKQHILELTLEAKVSTKLSPQTLENMIAEEGGYIALFKKKN